jgi:very-short-patch-repair endonuclease
MPGEVLEIDGIAVTSPATTLIDIAAEMSVASFERALGKADQADLIDPPTLRATIDRTPRRPGLGIARERLDRRSFVLTDSELERRFVPIALRAGLGEPVTRTDVNGFRVDFFWPELGLVVETDGLRYHRTPAQQTRDRIRDQTHVAAGLTPLRFTHEQIRYEPDRVEAILRTVTNRVLAARSNRL